MTDYRPNGHENWGVIAVKNASCDFANNVGRAVMADQGPGSEHDVNAYSPARKHTYTMHCVFDGGAGIRCTGGDDAEVHVWLNTGF